jgi:tetratricopeptide (TPR) repeat protein
MNMPRRDFASNFSEPLPDIEVPEAHISLRSVIRYIKGLLSSNSHIEGEASMRGDNLHLIVRVTKDGSPPSQPDIRTIVDKDTNAVLLEAAKHILRAIEPYILASYFYSTGDQESALVLIQYCLYHDPPEDDWWAYNLWGVILYDGGYYDDAIEMYRKAINIYPGNQFAVAYSNWALAAMKKEDSNDADEKCKIALSIDPSSPSSHNACGLVKRGEKKWDDAEAEFRQAVTLSPDFAAAYNSWGNLLEDRPDRKDYRKAKTMFLLAIEIDPDYSDAYNNLGDALENLQDLDAAVTMYRKASELDPSSDLSSVNLGDVLAKQRDFGGAAASYKQALERISKSAQNSAKRDERQAPVYIKLCDVSLDQRDFGKASEFLRKAFSLDRKVKLSEKSKDFNRKSKESKASSRL